MRSASGGTLCASTTSTPPSAHGCASSGSESRTGLKGSFFTQTPRAQWWQVEGGCQKEAMGLKGSVAPGSSARSQSLLPLPSVAGRWSRRFGHVKTEHRASHRARESCGCQPWGHPTSRLSHPPHCVHLIPSLQPQGCSKEGP